jgi:phage FluMu gp28-like protein
VHFERPWLYKKQWDAIFEPKDVFGNPARYSLIEASTKTGKTVGCIAWLFEQALKGARGQNYWWVAPVFGQAEIAFRRTKEGVPKDLYTSTESPPRITLMNGSVITFKSGEKPDGLFGEDVFAAAIDEASRMREEAFHALRTTMTATRGPMRIIGNVKGRKNWFFALCRRAEAGESGLSYHKLIAADAVQAGVLAREEVEDARRILPDAVFRELYLAEPSDDGGNPFGLAAIKECIEPIAATRPVVWGWDLAKHVDWTVGIALDQYGRVCRFERFQSPWDATIDRIVFLTAAVPALVDSTGVGDPIVEMLQKRPGTRFEGYNFNSASKQKLMEGLAVAIQKREVTFPDSPSPPNSPIPIRMELENFEYEYTRTGVRYSAPEGMHDDCVCALALANIHRARAQQPLVISDQVLQWAAGGRRRW